MSRALGVGVSALLGRGVDSGRVVRPMEDVTMKKNTALKIVQTAALPTRAEASEASSTIEEAMDAIAVCLDSIELAATESDNTCRFTSALCTLHSAVAKLNASHEVLRKLIPSNEGAK